MQYGYIRRFGIFFVEQRKQLQLILTMEAHCSYTEQAGMPMAVNRESPPQTWKQAVGARPCFLCSKNIPAGGIKGIKKF